MVRPEDADRPIPPADVPALTPDAEQENEKWAAYGNTILEFEDSPPLRVDLRAPVDAPTRTALRRLTGGAPFGVLTAENPAGENAADAATTLEEERREQRNERPAGRLERELRERGVRFLLVEGVSPDGVYREHCVAALLRRDDALARRYGQLARFWFDGECFWLLPGIAHKNARPLP